MELKKSAKLNDLIEVYDSCIKEGNPNPHDQKMIFAKLQSKEMSIAQYFTSKGNLNNPFMFEYKDYRQNEQGETANEISDFCVLDISNSEDIIERDKCNFLIA